MSHEIQAETIQADRKNHIRQLRLELYRARQLVRSCERQLVHLSNNYKLDGGNIEETMFTKEELKRYA